MHFDLHDNLTPPVTLLHHQHHHPSAYLHGDQQHRNTIMVCPRPPPPHTHLLPPPFFSLFASEMILLLCDMSLVGVGGASRAVHEVSMTTAPSILLIGDYGMLPPPPILNSPSSPPPPQMHTRTLCPQSRKGEVWGRGEKMQTEGEKWREKKEF